MKGVVIEGEKTLKEEKQTNIGLDCPDCGADMRKCTKISIKSRFNQDEDVMDTDCGESKVRFICDVCGYEEEVVEP